MARVAVRRNADVAPVNRDPDLVDLLAGDRHRSQPFGHERQNFDLASLRRYPDLVAALDALLAGQLIRNLDERFGLELHEVWHVLGHVVLVLGEPVAGGDVWELLGCAEPGRSAGRLVVEKRDR